MALDVLPLSRGFFKSLFCEELLSVFEPVLQILDARPLLVKNSTTKAYRVRLYDGLYSSVNCVISSSCGQQFEADNLLHGHGIFKVNSYTVGKGSEKPTLIIEKYTLLTANQLIVGDPIPYSETSQSYKELRVVTQSSNITPQYRLKMSPANSPTVPKTPTKRFSLFEPQPSPKKTFACMEQQNQLLVVITPLKLITPSIARWTIRGYVSQRKPIQAVTVNKKPSSVFSFVVTDSENMSIKVTAFGEEAEKHNKIIENGKVYTISSDGFNSVRSSNRRFNTTGHSYELIMSMDSTVELSDEFIAEPTFKINQISIGNISEHVDELVDVLAVVCKVDDVSQVKLRKNNETIDKREIFLVDASLMKVCLTVWGSSVHEFTAEIGEIIGVKGVTVKKFNDSLSLSAGSGTIVVINPKLAATQKLSDWYKTNMCEEFTSLSITSTSSTFERDFRTIGMLSQYEVLEHVEKNYFYVRGFITHDIHNQTYYKGCSNVQCRKKKLEELDDGVLQCKICHKTFTTSSCVYVLSLHMRVVDAIGNGSCYMSAIDDKAKILLGITGENLMKLHTSNPKEYAELLKSITYKNYIFRVGLRHEYYNDKRTLKWRIFDIKSDESSSEKTKKLYEDTFQKLGISLDDSDEE